MYSSFMTMIWHIGSVVIKTEKSRIKALSGLIPMLQWWGIIYLTFTYSDYAMENPAIATMVLFPTHGLITCRQIIANMTR
jgi:hypothetical protein